jgi:beta-galactosidase beta subunit
LLGFHVALANGAHLLLAQLEIYFQVVAQLVMPQLELIFQLHGQFMDCQLIVV